MNILSYTNGAWYDITAICGAPSWQSTIAELAVTLSFEVAKSDAQYFGGVLPVCGDIIILKTNEDIFKGIIITCDDGDRKTNKYTVCDFGFYLNKSKETYQFNNMRADKVINKLCSDFNIAIDDICDIPYSVSKIYMDKTISDIMRDVLELASASTGYAYNFDVTPKGLRVYRLGDLKAYPEFRISDNMPLIYSPDYKGSVSHSTSIEDMKNSVRIILGKEDIFVNLAIAKDNASIEKYGLLQEVEKIEDKATISPKALADRRLAELSKIKETYNFEMIEAVDSYTRAGYEIEIEGKAYIIASAAHSIVNGVHKVKIEVRL